MQQNTEFAELAIKSGFLKKKGATRKQWKMRFFVLRPTRLAYYANEKEYELLQMIPCNLITHVQQVKYKNRPNVLAITTRERTYYIQSTSFSDLNDWICAIRAILKHGANIAQGIEPHDKENLSRLFKIQSSLLENPDDYASFISEPSLLTVANSDLVNQESPSENRRLSIASNSSSSASDESIHSPQLPNITETSNPRINTSLPLEPSFETPVEENYLIDPNITSNGVLLDDIVLHKGYLVKLTSSRYSSRKKKRWFVLRPSALYIYKNDNEYSVLKIVNLDSILDVIILDDAKNSFRIAMVRKEIICYDDVGGVFASKIKEALGKCKRASSSVRASGVGA